MTDRSPLGSLPPSAKLVFKTLEYADFPLTQQGIITQSRLPDRTVRHALIALDQHDLIESAPCLTDARQCLYMIVKTATYHGSECPP